MSDFISISSAAAEMQRTMEGAEKALKELLQKVVRAILTVHPEPCEVLVTGKLREMVVGNTMPREFRRRLEEAVGAHGYRLRFISYDEEAELGLKATERYSQEALKRIAKTVRGLEELPVGFTMVVLQPGTKTTQGAPFQVGEDGDLHLVEGTARCFTDAGTTKHTAENPPATVWGPVAEWVREMVETYGAQAVVASGSSSYGLREGVTIALGPKQMMNPEEIRLAAEKATAKDEAAHAEQVAKVLEEARENGLDEDAALAAAKLRREFNRAKTFAKKCSDLAGAVDSANALFGMLAGLNFCVAARDKLHKLESSPAKGLPVLDWGGGQVQDPNADDKKATCDQQELVNAWEAYADARSRLEAAPVAEVAPVEAAPVEAAPVEAAPVEAAPVEDLDAQISEAVAGICGIWDGFRGKGPNPHFRGSSAYEEGFYDGDLAKQVREAER